MDVVSASPLRVASRAWRSIHGAWTLTVICRATFLLAPGQARLAPEQEVPDEDDVYVERDGRRLLRRASDIAPFKPRADVVLVGSAWAPPGWTGRTITARLAVAGLHRAVEVTSERGWGPEGQPVEGFGPIAPGWPTRLSKLGPHAGRWSPARWWEQPFPEGFDPSFFNVAPEDQRVKSLLGDEELVLENLHPEHARLSMRLPAVRPRAMAARASGSEEVALGCDTLWLDTNRRIGALVWRGWVRLRDPLEEGAVVVTLERGAATAEESATAAAALVEMAETLPFKKAPGAAATAPAAEDEDEDEEEPMVSTQAMPARRIESHIVAGTVAGALVPTGDALPFREAAEEVEAEPRTTRTGAPAGGGDASGSTRAEEPGAYRPSRGETVELTPETIAAAVAHGALPFEALAARGRGRQTPPPEVSATEVRAPETRSPETVQLPTAPLPLTPLPAPPPMIGPLARPEWPAEAKPEAPAAPTAEPAAPAEAVLEAKAEEPPGLPLAQYPLERCAAIAASAARRRQDEAAILEENELSPGLWEDLKRHWDTEIGKETRRGRMDLLRAYDAAYVAQLEKERGPITVEEHARIVIAKERGSLKEVLAELGLPVGAVMREERVWLVRSLRDQSLAKALRIAIQSS